MNQWTVEELAGATSGKIIYNSGLPIKGFGTDTRKSLDGQLFIALRGDQFDAHDFLKDAVDKGANCLLIDKIESVPKEFLNKISIVSVGDTLMGLQDFAKWHRGRFKIPILGITGSNGKTSTKEFTATLLSQTKKVSYSKGSLNNHWGVPMSMLQIESAHEMALLEIGMNHAGEIQNLVQLSEPTAVMCTMVGRAHIEHFGTIEKIAEAKEEIYQFAPRQAIRIYNRDNPWTEKMYQKSLTHFKESKKISFSQNNSYRGKVDVFFKLLESNTSSLVIEAEINGKVQKVTVPVFGHHNVINLMAASAGAYALGLNEEKIFSALTKCQTTWGRNQILRTQGGIEVLFDAYNANPDSMKALLNNLSKMAPPRGNLIGVFGEMLEMGSWSDQFHEELGEEVARIPFYKVFFIGKHHKEFRKGFSQITSDRDLVTSDGDSSQIAYQVRDYSRAGDLIVVKGSRGMKLEKVLKHLNIPGL